MDKRYNSKEVEPKIRKFWKVLKIFKFNPDSKNKIYSIDTPPPTVSGKLHVGHVMHYSQFEFVARFKRMMGYNVFFPFGFDDNGLPTQLLTEKTLGIKASKMNKEDFLKKVEQVVKTGRAEYKNIWEKMGISCDWSLLYTTIEPSSQKISQLSFIEIYNQGRLYRKESPALWCPKCSTAVSQVELEDKEFETHFNDIKFKLKDGKEIIISTTRPELLSSCVAIFVNPQDKKNKKLIGKKAIVPLFKQEVPILGDERADPEKGTGIVMCCTFGDQNDIEWYKAHNLPLKVSIDERGILTKVAGKYSGLNVNEARKKIVKDLENNNLIFSRKKIKHDVNTHERCGTPIEFLVKKQWFIKYLDLKEKFLKSGAKMKWYPDYMKVRLDNWINGLQWDWCISRQIYHGIPFPVWYCKKCGEVKLPEEKELPVDPTIDKPLTKCKCGSKEFEGENDVMNTWVTSSLTPLINAKWGEKNNLMKKIFPMDLRPQAHDIITFWLFNTMVKSLFHTNKVPFKDIMISGHGLDPKGKKMSKSKGNVVEPTSVVEKYSADALRFWAASARLGEDLPYQEKDVATGQKTIIKLWNASRFASMHMSNKKPKKLNIIDQGLLSKLMKIIKICTEKFEEYEYSHTKMHTEIFFWKEFCDNYLEMVKHKLYNTKDESPKYTLYFSLLTILKLFAPIMPYITEEIYQNLFKEKEKSIHVSTWPKYDKKLIDEEAEKCYELAKIIIWRVRKSKTRFEKSLNCEVKKLIIYATKEDIKILKKVEDDIKNTVKVKEIKYEETKEDGGPTIHEDLEFL